MTGPADGPGGAAAWPEIAATSRVVWPLVLWRATSEHPVLGAVRGRGLSHDAALRSLARQVQRRTSRASSSIESRSPLSSPDLRRSSMKRS